MKWVLAVIALAIFVALVLRLMWAERGYPKDAEKDAGTYANHFVRVDADGGIHELTSDDRDHLNTRFYPTDGNRPYIKGNYYERTPDGKLYGFLLRTRVPKGVPIVEA